MRYTPQSVLPPLRPDISGYQPAPGFVTLYDDMLYSDSMVNIPESLLRWLDAMDGLRTAESIAEKAARAMDPFPMDQFLKTVQALEDCFFLESPGFMAHRARADQQYNQAPERPAAFAGSSYPEDPVLLRRTLDTYVGSGAQQAQNQNSLPEPRAVIAPHIDPRVGGHSYGPAYNALRRSTADTFIIFGVSHRMSYDDFMISEKDFQTPLGPVRTDRQFIRRFRNLLPFELTTDETAHRREHSIEFQAVFLRHIFPDRDIAIVPILPGSFWEYVEEGTASPEDDQRLQTLYNTLQRTAAELGRKVCYIAGADLCHIGRKFGDTVPARAMFGQVEAFDRALLHHTVGLDHAGFLQELRLVRNKYRVCGVAPIYATLRACGATRGRVLCHDRWDEHDRDSAVTFASVELY